MRGTEATDYLRPLLDRLSRLGPGSGSPPRSIAYFTLLSSFSIRHQKVEPLRSLRQFQFQPLFGRSDERKEGKRLGRLGSQSATAAAAAESITSGTVPSLSQLFDGQAGEREERAGERAQPGQPEDTIKASFSSLFLSLSLSLSLSLLEIR